jgi:predicted AAA+ superfamily ATPase
MKGNLRIWTTLHSKCIIGQKFFIELSGEYPIMFIKRMLEKKLVEVAKSFPAVALLGPRQSGKTTLCRDAFKNHRYVNLEELDVRQYAVDDPRGFLDTYTTQSTQRGLILDEIQNAPHLLSYLQVRIDQEQRAGFYVLTGSHNMLLNQHLSQTLAGRISIQTLLPLSISELKKAGCLPQDLFELLYKGCYPSLYAKPHSPEDWYQSYIQTYLERDVRLVRNITDLGLFQKFIKLCAGRIGQLLDLTSLSNDCGIAVNTVKAWLSLLEASYILFLLPPYHRNFSKRLVKSPKLYFYDSGLACHLLQIDSPEALAQHYLRGGLFETLILSDLLKQRLNAGKRQNLFFWRDKSGLEIDCLLEEMNTLTPIEIKSAQTPHPDFFASLQKFCVLADLEPSSSYVVYGGKEHQKRAQGELLGWQDLDRVLSN